jgi:hypothetical protein
MLRSVVGQVANLQRVVNPLGPLPTTVERRLRTGAQDGILPRILPHKCIPVVVLLCLTGLAQAAIFPDQIGDYQKSAPKTVAVPDKALYDEYGMEATEQAQYAAPEKRFLATAWRFQDSTGAMAFFQAHRPAGATPNKLSQLSVATSDGVIFAYGNYLFQVTGDLPGKDDLQRLYAQLPRLEQSPLPSLIGFLPAEGLIPNSERYVVGPVSLERFEPRIAPSVAAFHLGAEAQLGRYQTPKGPLTLAIFNYPTPSMARERYEDFQKIPGAVAKRSGPLVAVVIQPADSDAAEKILSQVKYEANLVWNEKVPGNPARQLGSIFLNVFALSGVVGALGLAAGIGFGAFRVGLRKLGLKSAQPEAMITLHLGDK